MEKYVATIMNRVYSKDNNFIYTTGHVELGEVDEETGIFVDRNGNEYLPLLEKTLMFSEITDAYHNLVKINDIPKCMATKSIKEGISEYSYQCGRYIYYVSTSSTGSPFVVPISMDTMKDNVDYAMERYHQHKNASHVETYSETESDNQYKDDEYESLGEYLLDNIEYGTSKLLEEIMEGKYSLDELKQLRYDVEQYEYAIESIVESLALQIEASENHESSITLKGEDKEVKKEENAKKTKLKEQELINIKELYEKVTKTLIAQDEPARRVIVEIARKEQSPLNKNRAILITGPTGSGKTKMMQLIAKNLDKPFIKVDATQLTVPGYVGKDIEEMLWDLYVSCGKDKNKAEHAIVFFDEIDKKGSSKKEDVSGKGVLNVLLPFIEGSTYDATESLKNRGEIVKIDTSNMIVILGGAFTDVYKNLKESNGIGFGSTLDGKTREATTEDFIEKAKMPDEFMGRVSVVKLNDLDEAAIRRIMVESDESAILLQQQLFEKLGVKLTINDGYIDAVVSKAISKKTGARGLNTTVDESTWEAYGDAYSNVGQYSEIIINEKTVQDPKQYQKVYKKVNEG